MNARCPRPYKVRYPDEHEARQALLTIWAHAEPGEKCPTKFYRCPTTESVHWHLTSEGFGDRYVHWSQR